MSRLAQRVSDRRLLVLIGWLLRAKIVLPDGVVIGNEEGVPQGSPLSPLLSNVVLDELDWELARRGHRFVRYADDANVYVRSERAGLRVMASLAGFIEGRLRLKINEDKTAVARPEDRHFLGFRCDLVLDPQTGVVEILLSQRTKRNAMQKIRQLTPRPWGRTLDSCILQANAWLRGWHQFFRIALARRAVHVARPRRPSTAAVACDLAAPLEAPTDDCAQPHRPRRQTTGGMAGRLRGTQVSLGAQPHPTSRSGSTAGVLRRPRTRLARGATSPLARGDRCPDPRAVGVGVGIGQGRSMAGLI